MAMMGMFSYFLAEATEAAEEGFGLNFDLLETNIINLAIIIAILFFFGRKFLGNNLSERRSQIEEDITDAEKRAQKATADLKEAERKLAQAQKEVENIRQSAQASAQKAKERILAENAREVERIKEAAVQDLDAERERAVAEIKQYIARLALEKVESELKNQLDQSAQTKLIDRSLAQLGGGR
jgi:F-type H+-transporting ATPase subunit b